MEDRQQIRQYCSGANDADLVRAVTVARAESSATLLDEAARELERRSLKVEVFVDRVTVRVGSVEEAVTTVAEALAMVRDDVQRQAVAGFTNCFGETLLYQREGWGWVAHHYDDDTYALSYLLPSTQQARDVLERFLRLQDWRETAGDGHHLDDWKTLAASEDGEAVLALADRLVAANVPHVVRSPLFTQDGDRTVSLLVRAAQHAEAEAAAGTGRVPIRRLYRRARECDEAGDRAGELAVYEELAEADAGNAAVHYNHGVVLLETGRQEEAAAAFMRCIARGLERVKPSLDVGGSRSGAGGIFGVAARLAGRLASGSARPHYPDYLDDAELRLQALMEQSGPRRDMLHSLASVSRIKGDTEGATERYTRILEIDPEDEVARFQLNYLRAASD